MIFAADKILEIKTKAIAAGLHTKRKQMLFGINAEYVAGLDDATNPSDQLWSDLAAMNEDGSIEDGVPLERWLLNAAHASNTRTAAQKFFLELAEQASAVAKRLATVVPQDAAAPLGPGRPEAAAPRSKYQGVALWLEGIGLGRYAPIFIAHAIDFDALRRLSIEDVKELGLVLGHRKILLDAISVLRAEVSDANPSNNSELTSPRAESGGERRQMTVMSCHLLDSTELSSRLDPEDLGDVLRPYQAATSEAIARNGGFIAQHQMDGIVAYFGFPQASEGSAEGAVRAGLDIIAGVAKLKPANEAAIEVRVGIATGVAVVGELAGKGAEKTTSASGQVIGLAARIQTIAEPGTVYVSDSTMKLVSHAYQCHDVGAQRTKGIKRPTRLWRVDGERDVGAADEKPDGLHARTLLGRDKEIAYLKACWEQATKGEGQAILLVGDAGIGKSSLLREFATNAVSTDTMRMPLQCSARHSATPLYPLIVHLQRAAGFERTDDPATRLAKIEKLPAVGSFKDAAPLLAALLLVPDAGRLPLPMSPAQQKSETLRLLVEQIVILAKDKPVLMLVEDVQWMDPTTEELSTQLIDVLPGKRVMIVATSRPEYRAPWADRPHVSTLSLPRLGQDSVKQLIHQTSEGKRLSKPIIDEILARADGIPLFVEELTKSVLDSASSDSADATGRSEPLLSIPSTLHDSLMARLDRLGPAKNLAQLGAAVGRKFTLAIMMSVTGDDQLRIIDGMGRLIAAGVVYKRGEPPDVTYTFKHALIQDAAYQSLLRPKKRTLHSKIATAIENEFRDIAEAEPEALAHHWRHAEVPDKAARYCLIAGQRALARSANMEAIRHLTTGIGALAQAPDKAQEGLLEFNLHLGLGQASYVVRGPAARETVEAYLRAQELVEHVRESEQRFAVLYGIFSGYHFASKFELAEAPARRMMGLAVRDQDPGHICQAHRMLGYLSFFRGDTADALEHFRQVASLYVPEKHRELASRYGADCLIATRGFQAIIECLSSRPRDGIARASANLDDALGLGHAATIGWAFASAAYMYFFVRDQSAARELSLKGIRFCEENNVGVWGAHCRVFHAWASARLADPSDSILEINNCIVQLEPRISLGIPLFRAVLADVLLADGNHEQALSEAEAALRATAVTHQFFFEPVLHETKARCLLALSRCNTDVADCLHQSMSAAKRIGAKLLELRAATSLAGLSSGTGSKQDREVLAVLYRGFSSDELDLPDLNAARQFLGSEPTT